MTGDDLRRAERGMQPRMRWVLLAVCKGHDTPSKIADYLQVNTSPYYGEPRALPSKSVATTLGTLVRRGFLARANDERVKLTELGLAYRARTIEETKRAIPWQRSNVERLYKEIARQFRERDEWARLARNSEKDLVELGAAVDAS